MHLDVIRATSKRLAATQDHWRLIRETGRNWPYLDVLRQSGGPHFSEAALFFQSRPCHLFIQVTVQMRLNTPKCLIITQDAAHHQGAFK
jgi:hypothetical protein